MSVVPKLGKLLYSENHKTLMREIQDLDQWRVNLCRWVGRFNIFKVTFSPKFADCT